MAANPANFAEDMDADDGDVESETPGALLGPSRNSSLTAHPESLANGYQPPTAAETAGAAERRGLVENNGEMGRIYGAQWRKWQGNGKTVDQLQEAIDLIRDNPGSRRILVNAWNAAEIDSDSVALPPCHTFFQFYVAEGRLSMQMYQRSCDMFLGVPLNIASYSILLCMVARITNLEPHEFIHTLGDSHIYLNHIDVVRAQLEREPLPLPELRIEDRGQETIDDFVFDDFELINYQSHDAIKAVMAV